jgi:subtilisin family serine protease
MKNLNQMITIVSIFILSCSISLFSQTKAVKPTVKKQILVKSNTPSSLSGYGQRLLNKAGRLKNCQPDTSLIEEFGLLQINDIVYAGAMMQIHNLSAIQLLKSKGVKVGARAGMILSVKIPVNQLEEISNLDQVVFIDIDVPILQKLDKVREHTGADLVHAGYELPQGYCGQGVVVGIIDGGMDYTHPSLWDTSLSTYRLIRVWDQNNDNLPPTGYSYGHEMIAQGDILAEETDLTDDSHASHVTGIAAGGYSGITHDFTGVAPESSIMFVSYRYSNSDIADGIAYIFDQAEQLSMPAVINLSLGEHFGPHDGTSMFDRFIDSITGPGKIIVGAAGNEGGDTIHLQKTFSATDSLLYTFVKFPWGDNLTYGYGYIDIWGEPGKEFYVSINVYDIENDEYEDYTDYMSSTNSGLHTYSLADTDPDGTDYIYADMEIVPVDPYSGKPNVLVYFDNEVQNGPGDGYDFIEIEILCTEDNTIHMWNSFADGYFTDLEYLENSCGDPDYTVGELGGIASSIISVGAYTTKNEYYDYSNSHQIIYYDTAIGALAPFSSRGPTVDGRMKPDITAPGNVIVSAINSFDVTYDTNEVEVTHGITPMSKEYLFAAFEGTSMSAPVVTGIIALLLEENPNLCPADVKTLLQNNAISDTNTSAVPNHSWGYGKVNAHALTKELAVGIEVPVAPSGLALYPNPSKGTFRVDLPDGMSNNAMLNITDLRGKVVYSCLLNSSFSTITVNLPVGIYVINVLDAIYSYSEKLVVFE